MLSPTTYQDLLTTQERLVRQGNTNPRTAANRASALRSFLKIHNIQLEDPIGQEFRTTYREHVEQFIEHLRIEGRKQHNITNTLAALRPWREMVVAIDTDRAVAGDNLAPFNQALTRLLDSHPIANLAKQLSIPVDMLYGWLKGKKPRLSNASHVYRIEKFFGVEQGELALLAGISHGRLVMPTVGAPTAVRYREGLAARTAFHYFLKPAVDSSLREQWYDYMRYKTEWDPMLARADRAVWRVAPFQFHVETEATWPQFLDGAEVPAAKMAWAKYAGYLGWLALPKTQDGVGLGEDCLQTLAWLAVKEHVEAYVRWMVRRSGNTYNGSVFEFFAKVKSVLRVGSGYLRQQPKMLRSLPESYQSRSWEDMCQETFALLHNMSLRFEKERKQTRDPKEPMRHILELAQPLDLVADMLLRLRADRPISKAPVREAMWGRDVALIKLIVSNPLRLRNLATLTWRPDNTGELYQRVDGSWWIRIEKGNFKNTRGAAGDQEYDMPVQPMVWADLERYLKQFRPRLRRCETDFVFLAGGCGSCPRDPRLPWSNLSGRISDLTRKYLWRCAGIGTHAFRHIVATSIIKASNLSDFKTAALVLNDSLSTVEKNYAHLRSADGGNRMGELLGASLSRM